MKKVLKNTLLLLAMIAIVCTMAGCGQKDSKKESKTEDNGEKIVATRTVKADEELVSFGGDYKETVVVTFVDGKVDNAELIYDCEEEETAKTMYSFYSLAKMEYKGIKCKQDGKKTTITLDSESFAAIVTKEEDELTKDDVVAYFEEEGYTVE